VPQQQQQQQKLHQRDLRTREAFIIKRSAANKAKIEESIKLASLVAVRLSSFNRAMTK